MSDYDIDSRFTFSDEQGNPCNGAVGDPDALLSVATMVMAGQRLRIAGARGPFEYRLSVWQGNDIEGALVAMAHPTALGRGIASFRGVPVFASGVDIDGRIVDPASGRWVAILSQQDDPKGFGRVPDHRKATLPVGERAAP